MTATTSGIARGITGAEFNNVTFSSAKGFSRGGYDPREVDNFLHNCAAAVDWLNQRLVSAEERLQAAGVLIAQLRDRIDRDNRSNPVEHALSVLATAQMTADSTVARADEYSARVMAEARDFDEETRRIAAILEQETEEKARAVYNDALRRVDDLEGEHNERLAQLTLQLCITQQELDDQTLYLRKLRDATRAQMTAFLEGLDPLVEEYGRADPMTADAAAGTEQDTPTVTDPAAE